MNQSEWAHSGPFFELASPKATLETLPPGIYVLGSTPGGWYLKLQTKKFTFNHKIYGSNDKLIHRIHKQWDTAKGNFGVLFNGLKGSGKTVTSKLIANSFVDKGVPVILVNSGIPLNNILPSIDQPLALIFDEFEKTHGPEAQEALLSVLDGVAKSNHPRLFLLTTNNPHINSNMLDRPARIRYKANFGRLEKDVVEELIEDKLRPELSHFREAVMKFLISRATLSMDMACEVITEVNVHEESPYEFESIFNSKRINTLGYKVEILDPETDEVKQVFSEYFIPLERDFTIKLLDGIFPMTFQSKYSYPCEQGWVVHILDKIDTDTYVAELAIPLKASPIQARLDLFNKRNPDDTIDFYQENHILWLDEETETDYFDDFDSLTPEEQRDMLIDLIDSNSHNFNAENRKKFKIKMTDLLELPRQTYDLSGL